MKVLNLFILTLILIQIHIIFGDICGADQIKIEPKILNTTKRLKTNKVPAYDSDIYTPIAIGYDFTTLDKPLTMSSSTFSSVISLLKETREEFSKILQVKHRNIDLSDDLKYIMETCTLEKIGKDYPNFLINNDIIIFPIFQKLEPGVIAAASPCLWGEINRPYGGILLINTDLDLNRANAHLYMKNIFFHEITHILAFHPSIFQLKNMMKKVGNMNYLISKNVIKRAKEHFDCSSLTQIPLENQGGEGNAGYHWEARYMLGDYMISTDYPDVAISNITLAVFEDTGFYKVNYYSAGLFKYGKNKGCDFFERKCIANKKVQFDEFCDVTDEPRCSFSMTLKSSCFLVYHLTNLPEQYQYFSDKTRGGYPAASYCPVPYEPHSSYSYYQHHCQFGISTLPSDYGETIGKESFCFMSSLIPNNSKEVLEYQIPICYAVECNEEKKRIILKIGSENITCPTNGGTVSRIDRFNGTIECPKYEEICLTTNKENYKCNEMFNCFTELAYKNNYSYDIIYYDYDGPTAEISYGNDTYDDDDIHIYKSGSNNIKINLAVFLISMVLFFE